MAFERTRSEEVFTGNLLRVRREFFHHDDTGEEVERELEAHPGAAVIVAHDQRSVYMVAQPREVVGEQSLLELPAGKIDVEGEELLATAKRELAEEIGMGARQWRHLVSFYNSPGLLSEENHLFLAEGLYEQSADSGEEERIEIVRLPLADLDATIPTLKDAKTLIGLLWLRSFVLGS